MPREDGKSFKECFGNFSNFPPSKERDALNEVIAYTGARKK